MKASDLQIGDYIKFNGDIYIIEELSAKGWVHLINKDKIRLSLPSDYILDYIEPIPLTQKILERNGFKESKYGEMILDEELDTSEIYLVFEIYLVLEPNYDDTYYWWKVNNELITKIKSVHELQHALRLCGINKEIDI